MSEGAGRSIEAVSTFRGATAAYFRRFGQPGLLYLLLFLPLALILFAAAPNFAGAMMGRPPVDIPPAELVVFMGVLVVGMTLGALVTAAAAFIADAALHGDVVPGSREALARGLGRLPALAGAYLLLIGIVLLPMSPLFGLLLLLPRQPMDEPPVAAVLGLGLGMIVVLPIVFALGIYLRFGPLLAILRGDGPIAATREGFALVRGRFWRTAGYVALVGIVVQVVMMLSSIPSMLAGLGAAAAGDASGPVGFPGFIIFGIAMSLCVGFQVTHDVALLRRLENLHAPPAFDDPAPDPLPNE